MDIAINVWLLVLVENRKTLDYRLFDHNGCQSYNFEGMQVTVGAPARHVLPRPLGGGGVPMKISLFYRWCTTCICN